MSAEIQPRLPFVVLEEFLVAEEWQNLFRYAYERSSDFSPTRIVGANGQDQVDATYRRSRVLFDVGDFSNVFMERILCFFPRILAGLNHPSFDVSGVEIQLTASNHGEFFRAHSDSDRNALQSRRISFVYFFYREPRPFSGGELCLYEPEYEDWDRRSRGKCSIYSPAQNQIVFFLSDFFHEVLPVNCPSRDFMSSRFTVNGWLHQ